MNYVLDELEKLMVSVQHHDITISRYHHHRFHRRSLTVPRRHPLAYLLFVGDPARPPGA